MEKRRWHKLGVDTPCHITKAADALLEAYRLDTEHGPLVNAQLHDMVDNIERQATDWVYARLGRQWAEPQAFFRPPSMWTRIRASLRL